ncbi:unnamed protein product [Blepharisma stoltei]|uniref:Uncharacterized protein n=1 Tax=Blepharisma stoltei TaxID=1481888 RepID=A0AAU9ITQ3_9CILI|nr:unnamed protein product [Blepharisma stoltei]
MFKRKDIKTSDVLDCPYENLRRGFAESACAVGAFKTSSGTNTAHILYFQPLIIGTVTTEETGNFYPESPGFYGKFTSCKSIAKSSNNYTLMQCDKIDGDALRLKAAYPKIYSKDEDKYFLGYSNENQQKILTKNPEEISMKGAILTDIGTDKIFGVVGENGVIDVDEFYEIYDNYIYPRAQIYNTTISKHYFTYFREYEVKHELSHKGREGNRPRFIDMSLRREKYKKMVKDFIKKYIYNYDG